MSKHTPVEWHAVGSWVEVESDDIPDICCCDPNHMGQASLPRSDEETCANARLIAAAPELLEALQLMLSQISGWGGDRTPLDKAIAAIAKATGEFK